MGAYVRTEMWLPSVVVGLVVGVSPPTAALAQDFVYIDDNDPSTMNPLFGQSMSDLRLNELMYRGLFEHDRQHAAVPVLADRLELSEDRRVATIYLGEHQWSDGRSVTAQDVEFTVNSMIDPSIGASDAGMLRFVARCRALDVDRVRIWFKYPVFEPEQRLMFKILPRHVLGRDGRPSRRNDPLRKGHPSAGPYSVARQEGSIIELRANKGASVSFDRITARYMPDPTQRVDAIQYKFAHAVVNLTPKDIPRLQALSDQVTIYPYDATTWWYIGIRHDHWALKNVEVRKAIVSALDRDQLRKAGGFGGGSKITGPFSPRSPYYDHSVEPYEYSGERVAAQLRAAGLRRYKNKWRAGRRALRLRMVYDKEQSYKTDILLQIQAALGRQGIEVRLEPLDSASFRRRIYHTKDFDLVLRSWTFDAASDVYELFHSRGALNFIGYSSREMDALLDGTRTAVTPERLKALHRVIHRLAHKELPYVFLWTVAGNSAVSNRVTGVNIHPYRYFTWIRDWRWRK